MVYGPFLTYEWAVLDAAVGRFGPGYRPFLPFAWAVLVHGPFWYRPYTPLRWGSLQHSRKPSWWGGVENPLSKNPGQKSAFGGLNNEK